MDIQQPSPANQARRASIDAMDACAVAADEGWRRELFDLVRAASGGLLFGIPLIYTMEMWWTAEHTSTEQTLLVLALIFVPVLVLNRTSGFRSTKDVRFADAAKDTVEAVALGVVMVTAVLFLLREIRTDTPLQVALAKIVYEAMPFCLGIAVATHFLRQGRTEPDDGADGDDRADDTGDDTADNPRERRLNATAADLGAGLVGATFIALNIAPTDEIPMIAAQLSAGWLVAFVAVSLLVSYGIVFVAGFTNQDQRHTQVGIFQRPFPETVISYFIALISAGAMLLLFQRMDGPWHESLGHVIVLGLPAAIGSAAGRLAI